MSLRKSKFQDLLDLAECIKEAESTRISKESLDQAYRERQNALAAISNEIQEAKNTLAGHEQDIADAKAFAAAARESARQEATKIVSAAKTEAEAIRKRTELFSKQREDGMRSREDTSKAKVEVALAEVEDLNQEKHRLEGVLTDLRRRLAALTNG